MITKNRIMTVHSVRLLPEIAFAAGGPLPARRFPGDRGGAAYFFECIWFLLGPD